MNRNQPIIASQLFAFANTNFEVQIVDLYPDLDDSRKYHFCWQAVCEGVTSQQKEVDASFNHFMTEPPEIDDEMKVVLAKANLRLFALWSDQGIVSICFQDGSSHAINYVIDWHTKLKTFNPHAWRNAA